MIHLACLLALRAWSLLAAVAFVEDNAIFEELTTRGVQLNGVTVRLPAPTLADGLSASEQQAALASIADTNHPVSALVRNAVVAPLVLRMEDEPKKGAVRPRRVDLWFVVYGDIEKLGDEDFLIKQANEEARADGQQFSQEGHILTADELRTHSISTNSGERYVAGRFTLFDRVQISGTMRTKLTRTAESVTTAGRLDPRFDQKAEFPNVWRSIKRDAEGRASLGRPQPYRGVGWFAKATKLADPAGAILIEVHTVFDEPAEWFNGANLLRSKLPIVLQDKARAVRRRLASAR
jgi:hypothetical protein